ncbi:MAG: tetratricopeptide repeat protein [Acidiferrobacteraceae bacterium]
MISRRMGIVVMLAALSPSCYASGLTPAAEYQRGEAYRSGHGVPKSWTKAVYWWRKAAVQGYARAEYNLGAAYCFGVGVPENGTKAVYWLRKAAAQGNAHSQNMLWFIYTTGQSVPENYVHAYKWAVLAKQSVGSLHLLASYMTPSQVARAQSLARAWERAHESQHAQ